MGKASKLHRKKVANRNQRIKQQQRSIAKKIILMYNEQEAAKQEEEKPTVWIPGTSGPSLG